MVGAVGAGFTAVPFVVSWQPSERAKALGAPVEVDIGKLEPGMRTGVEWRGKAVWVVRRTEEARAAMEKDKAQLRDASSSDSDQPPYATNDYRALKPEYLEGVDLLIVRELIGGLYFARPKKRGRTARGRRRSVRKRRTLAAA